MENDAEATAAAPPVVRKLYDRCLNVFTSSVTRKQLYQNPYLQSLPPRILADIYLQASVKKCPDLKCFFFIFGVCLFVRR